MAGAGVAGDWTGAGVALGAGNDSPSMGGFERLVIIFETGRAEQWITAVSFPLANTKMISSVWSQWCTLFTIPQLSAGTVYSV